MTICEVNFICLCVKVLVGIPYGMTILIADTMLDPSHQKNVAMRDLEFAPMSSFNSSGVKSPTLDRSASTYSLPLQVVDDI